MWSDKDVGGGISKKSDRVVGIKSVLEINIASVTSAGTLHKSDGEKEDEKNAFCRDKDEIIQEALEKKKIIIEGDLNGHVGEESQRSKRVNGYWRFKERNETGDGILEFLEWVHDLDIVHTFFKKERDENIFITYKSEGNKTQVDYLLVKNKMSKECNRAVR